MDGENAPGYTAVMRIAPVAIMLHAQLAQGSQKKAYYGHPRSVEDHELNLVSHHLITPATGHFGNSVEDISLRGPHIKSQRNLPIDTSSQNSHKCRDGAT
jgi:hypothetical protein